MQLNQTWYVVKQDDGTCEIIASGTKPEDASGRQSWGPFDSTETAIARRVGLIRAGQCRPTVAEPQAAVLWGESFRKIKSSWQ